MSRERAQNEKLLKIDTAAPAIIQHSKHAHTWARFYFRPCTPTQASAEGIRPVSKIRLDAKRPVPIVFAFDARGMLTRSTAVFTEGNFSTEGCSSGDDAEFFASLPFSEIYHDSAVQPGSNQQRQIVFHRCAEILYDDAVDISDLREVICRTGPERDSLLYTLASDARHWESIIRVVRRGERMFFPQWAFITSAALVGNEVRLLSNPVPFGPYRVRLRVWRPRVADPIVDATETRDRLTEPIVAALPADVGRVLVRCDIEGHLAYRAVLSRRAVFG